VSTLKEFEKRKSSGESENFEDMWEEHLQNLKRIKALIRHYRQTAKKKLPLQYGHVQILREVVKMRFLAPSEQGLLKYLCQEENLDYTLKSKFNLYGKGNKEVQFNMFPEMFTFEFPASSVELGEDVVAGRCRA